MGSSQGGSLCLPLGEQIFPAAVYRQGLGLHPKHPGGDAAFKYVVCRALGGHLPFLQHHHPVAVGKGQGQVVEHHHHGFAHAVDLPHQLHHLEFLADVQIGGGLVQKQHLGVLGQGHGQVHPLPFPAGELGKFLFRKPGGAGGLHGPGDLFPVGLGQVPAKAQVGIAAVGHQLPCPNGGDVPGLGQDGRQAGKLLAAKLAQGLAIVEHLPPLEGQQPAGGSQQGGLAAAVGADERGDLPGFKSQADVLQHRAARIPGSDAVQFNHGKPPSCWGGCGADAASGSRTGRRGPPES